MSIPFTATVIESTPAGITVVYSSPGRPDITYGLPAVREGQSLDQIVNAYAPIQTWLDMQAPPPLEIPVGTVVSYEPPPIEIETFQSAKAKKLAEAAEWRYNLEVAGVTMPGGGARIATDRESQAKVAAALQSLQSGFITSVNWKTVTGEFVTLGLEEISVIARTVARYVKACFDAEQIVIAQIEQCQTMRELEQVAFPNEIIAG